MEQQAERIYKENLNDEPSFEEKAFFDILISIRDRQKFEYPEEKCKELAKEIKTLVDQTSVYADFLNNDLLRYGLSANLLKLLYRRGYPPEFNEEVFQKVFSQVENYHDHAKPVLQFRPRETAVPFADAAKPVPAFAPKG